MADKKISALTPATTPLAGTEVLPIVQGAATVKVSVDNLTEGRTVTAAGLTVDTNTVYVDATNHRLGVGTLTPSKKFVVSDAGAIGLEFSPNDAGTGTSRLLVYNRTTPGYAPFRIQGSEVYVDSGGSESFRLSTAQDALVQKGNLIPSTAGKGINFTANTPAAGMTSQLLNWYEEGTWTPVVKGDGTAGTYELDGTLTKCSYVRVGRMVALTAFIKFASSVTGGGTGELIITGVPFVSGGATFPQGSIGLYGINFTSGSGVSIGFSGWDAGQNTLYIRVTTANSAWSYVPISGVSAGNQMAFTFTYMA